MGVADFQDRPFKAKVLAYQQGVEHIVFSCCPLMRLAERVKMLNKLGLLSDRYGTKMHLIRLT